jgi:competence protein ComEA
MKYIILALLVALTSPGYAEPVNINTASAQEIAAALSGIGPVKARRIVEYRKLHGPYRAPVDLVMVKGFGAKTLERLKQDIRVQD